MVQLFGRKPDENVFRARGSLGERELKNGQFFFSRGAGDWGVALAGDFGSAGGFMHFSR